MAPKQGLRSAAQAPGHELVDHTSEITVRIRAPTYAELIGEATRAFAELVPASLRGRANESPRDLRVEGVDKTALLVQWLNEIVYLCEVEHWLPTEVDLIETKGSVLRVRARGVPLEGPFAFVKAATLHRAAVDERPEGLVAEVTLDV